MQEEVENRTVNLAISTTKLTARSIVRLGLKGIAYIKRKSKEAAMKNEKPTGKQTIQELIGQNQGVTNIDISKTDLKGFEKYARKYGVDYAITKDKSVLPPKYLVFFKARDADAMTAAFNAYSAEILAKTKRPSVLKTLHKLIDAVRDIPAKVVSRDVYIKHHNITAGTRTFKPDTKGAELVPELKVVSDHIFVKTKSNALTSEAFAAFIADNEIGEFYIAGADATACVKSTCFNMTKAGYTVHVISGCVTSYDLKKVGEMLDYYAKKGCEVKPLSEYMN